MAKVKFEYNDINLRTNIADMSRKVDRALKGTMSFHADEGTTYMKEHAPWTDRTTNARNGLHAIVPPRVDVGNTKRYEIIFSHTMHYGIWLEVANSGRYQIIMPTVRHEGELLMRRLEGLLPKLEKSNL